jgi:hypothetical protein
VSLGRLAVVQRDWVHRCVSFDVPDQVHQRGESVKVTKLQRYVKISTMLVPYPKSETTPELFATLVDEDLLGAYPDTDIVDHLFQLTLVSSRERELVVRPQVLNEQEVLVADPFSDFETFSVGLLFLSLGFRIPHAQSA